jgi:hypothetical protein
VFADLTLSGQGDAPRAAVVVDIREAGARAVSALYGGSRSAGARPYGSCFSTRGRVVTRRYSEAATASACS